MGVGGGRGEEPSLESSRLIKKKEENPYPTRAQSEGGGVAGLPEHQLPKYED